MTRFRREGWPILFPEGWRDMSAAERRAWWDDVWNWRIRPEFFVPPKGRPDTLAWSGALVKRRLRIICTDCGRLLARLDDYERGPVLTIGDQHRSSYGWKLPCPEHGRVPAPAARLRRYLDRARHEGKCLPVEVGPLLT